MQALNESHADIAAYPLTLIEPRPDGADFTYSFLNGGLGILVRGGSSCCLFAFMLARFS